MNKQILLELLLTDLEKRIDGCIPKEGISPDSLDEILVELNNRRPIEAPKNIPPQSEEALVFLREFFKDRVSFVSLYLSALFPSEYIFYRVSKLEKEIFDGFAFLADDLPLLDFPFSSIGQNGMDNYLTLNSNLQELGRDLWPAEEDRQRRIHYLIYHGLGDLFCEKADYNRYWLFVTREELPPLGEPIVWAARKEMQAGDLVFLYRTSPISAVTTILETKAAPLFDPWGAWNGFWVELERLADLDPIPFSRLRADPVLGEWGAVRKQFTGSVSEAVPHSVYNRFLDLLPATVKEDLSLEPEPLANLPSSGTFSSEAEFDDKVVAPLLKNWGLKFTYQHPCRFHMGSQVTTGRVDFFVEDSGGPLTLVEDKYKIVTDEDLKSAVAQAKSYALMLGVPSFMVCAPEGLWVYSLKMNRETLVIQRSLSELEDKGREEEVRLLLHRIRQWLAPAKLAAMSHIGPTPARSTPTALHTGHPPAFNTKIRNPPSR